MSDSQRWKHMENGFRMGEPPGDCLHGWYLPPGVECPDCLWEQAAKRPTSGQSGNVLVVRREKMIAAMFQCVPVSERIHLKQIMEEQSNWHALREARRINQERGGGR